MGRVKKVLDPDRVLGSSMFVRERKTKRNHIRPGLLQFLFLFVFFPFNLSLFPLSRVALLVSVQFSLFVTVARCGAQVWLTELVTFVPEGHCKGFGFDSLGHLICVVLVNKQAVKIY